MGSPDSLERIVLFDGVCNLCSSSVQFIIARNSKKNIKFAALQSDFGQAQLTKYQLSSEVRTIVLIKGEQIFTRSAAVLEICKELNGLYPLLVFLKIIPRPLCDWIYNFVARRRYRWFGKKDQCWLPTPDLQSRFIS
jgi:predicted DCC family thiol-disulfide oxidoreductase YuxK